MKRLREMLHLLFSSPHTLWLESEVERLREDNRLLLERITGQRIPRASVAPQSASVARGSEHPAPPAARKRKTWHQATRGIEMQLARERLALEAEVREYLRQPKETN